MTCILSFQCSDFNVIVKKQRQAATFFCCLCGVWVIIWGREVDRRNKGKPPNLPSQNQFLFFLVMLNKKHNSFCSVHIHWETAWNCETDCTPRLKAELSKTQFYCLKRLDTARFVTSYRYSVYKSIPNTEMYSDGN